MRKAFKLSSPRNGIKKTVVSDLGLKGHLSACTFKYNESQLVVQSLTSVIMMTTFMVTLAILVTRNEYESLVLTSQNRDSMVL